MHASERESPRVEALRALHWQLVQGLAPEDLVFLDEFGAKLNLILLYGWGEKGERVPGSVPLNLQENLTVIGAMNLTGLLCLMTVNGSTDGEVFLAFVREVLVPVLRKGQVVILDNLRAHKVEGVRELIEQAGAEVLYLPPYSPDYNPIEHCWSKLKHWLRKAAARTRDALEQALREVLPRVTDSDAHGWFSECGYL